MHPRSRTVRPGRIVLGILVAALLVLPGSGRPVTMQPPAVATDLPDAEVLVDVTEQTLGRQLNSNVTVSQPRRVLAANALTGVVTSVSDTPVRWPWGRVVPRGGCPGASGAGRHPVPPGVGSA